MSAALETLTIATDVIDETARPAGLPSLIPAEASASPIALMQAAIERGYDIDKIERLLMLQERWEANRARNAFTAAMAKFKQSPLRVEKQKRVYFENKSGGVTDYMHATLANVCDVAVPGLAAVGISHRWTTDQRDGLIYVTCILTHELGHSESATLFGSPDQSGGKNAIQAVVSTTTYLKRDTLKSVTGIAEHDGTDDDGRGHADAEPARPVAPPDYEAWKADMTALADNGLQALQDCWKRSAPDLRQYATIADPVWLANVKARASKVQS